MKVFYPLIIILLFFSSNVFAKENINKNHLAIGTNLKVINVDIRDKLNLREEPTYKSKLIIAIPYNSRDLKVSNTGVTLGDFNKWVNIDYCSKSNENCFNGWVNSKYIMPFEKKQTITTDKLIIKYPSFLNVTKENGWLRLKHSSSYKHEQWQDGKDGIKAYDHYTDFDLNVKYYSSLGLALKENYLEDYDLEGEYVSMGPIQKLENGYKIRTGAEGVGSYYYVIIKKNGVLLFDSPYNINPITSLQKNKPLNILSAEERQNIERLLIEETTIHEKSTVRDSQKEKTKKIEPTEKSLIKKLESGSQTKPTETIAPLVVAKQKLNTKPPQKSEAIIAKKIEATEKSAGSFPLSLLAPLFGLLVWRMS